MNTYLLADSLSLQPSREPSGLALFNWIKRRLAARRARTAEREAIAYLRTLDRYALEDMGVDVLAMGERVPRLIALNPYAVAMTALTPDQGR